MGKLHEVIAVEPGKKGFAEKISNETQGVFGKPEFFQEWVRTLKMDEPGHPEDGIIDRQAMTTTVPQKLNWLSAAMVPYLDVVYQKETTNGYAKADLVVRGKILIKDAPATFLLGLETKLIRLREIFDAIPTHGAGVHWVSDPDFRFKTVVRSEFDEIKTKTRKIISPFILVQATDKHPAQVEKLSEDVVVGRFYLQRWSGCLSPAAKADLLGRVDELIDAAKRARMQANEVEANTVIPGQILLDFILGPDIKACGLGKVEQEQ